jgi:hypothetical protein
MHEIFVSAIVSLFMARDKANDFRYDSISAEVSKKIASVVNKLNDLEKIIEPHFILSQQD